MSLESALRAYQPLLDDLIVEVEATRNLGALLGDDALVADGDCGVEIVDRIVENLLRLPTSNLNAREALELVLELAKATVGTITRLRARRAEFVRGNG